MLALIVILPYYGIGQEALELSLEKSLEIAFQKNPQFKIAEKEVEKAKASVWTAYSNLMPQLNGAVNFQHAWEIQKNTIPNFLKPMLGPLAGMIPELKDMPDFVQLSFGLENSFQYGVTLTQPLFLGGAGIAGIQIASAAKRASEMNLETQRQNLIFQVAGAFYSCLVTREVAKVQEQTLKQAEANFEIVGKKYSAGSASGYDKMRAEVNVANLKPGVISSRNQYQSALTQFRAILGLEENRQIAVDGKFDYVADDFGEKSLTEIKKMALENRPEKRVLIEQKYMAGKGVMIARSSFMPKLFFQSDYSYLAMKNDFKLSQSDFNRGITSAVSLQIPLFTGFRNAKEFQKAKLDFHIVEDAEKQLNDGLSAEAEMIYNKFKEANEKYLAASQTVQLAEETLRLANMMYEEGTNTQLDVLNMQLALNQARLNYASSVFEYQMARYQLRKVTGTLNSIL
jgi:outer membrane protein TolC